MVSATKSLVAICSDDQVEFVTPDSCCVGVHGDSRMSDVCATSTLGSNRSVAERLISKSA